MSTINQFQMFAECNRLMKVRLYEAASRLPDSDLRCDRGAFFKSVLGTLNHIMVGDIIWLKRFSTHSSSAKALRYVEKMDRPRDLDAVLFSDLRPLRVQRKKVDEVIVQWIYFLSEATL